MSATSPSRIRDRSRKGHPGRIIDQRHCRGIGERHGRGKAITLVCGNRYLFRIATLFRHRQDPVTDVELVHFLTQRFHHPDRGPYRV